MYLKIKSIISIFVVEVETLLRENFIKLYSYIQNEEHLNKLSNITEDAWDKCSGLVHWEDPKESGGEGGGRGDRDGEYI